MTDGEPVGSGAAGPASAGETLKGAREAQGLTLDDISARTRVPVRHLAAVEAEDYRALPSPTYAVGFARAYARAVGVSDAMVAGQVRAEVNRIGPRQPEYTPYEMADPARVPSRGVAVAALGLALALLILGGLWFASTRFTSGGGAETSPSNAVVAAIPAAPAPAAAPTLKGGQVSLAATDEVWLRVYDADNTTLFTGNMKAGDRFDVPPGANDPRINVGRPDKLRITLNGSAVPPLGDGSRPISGVRVSGEAIAQRLTGAPTPGPSPTETPVAAAEASPAAAPAALPPAFAPQPASRPAAERRPAPRRTAAPRPRRQLTETQRANLESAARLRGEQRDR